MHVDCDAFYAAVELLDRPELADVPFAVGGGVLTTCNYVARTFGCRSGMAGFVAKKLCPALVLLRPDFAKYNAKAQEVRAVLAAYDARFESASIDEAYLNVTEYCAARGVTPAEAVARMRREVAERTRVTVSAGIAANAKLAKICSNINKPDGQFELANDRTVILDFMRALPCRKVNGVGRVLERELAAVGVETCGDVYGQRQYLARLFGDKAFAFLAACHLGLGRTRVQPAEEYERKSVGTESTFGALAGPAAFRAKLRWTADELEKDLRRAECKGRTLVLKVKLHTFEVYTRQVVMPCAVWRADDLYHHALPVLAKLEQEMPGMVLRLMGLRCTHLVSTKKPDTRAFFGFRPRRGDSAEREGGGSGEGGLGASDDERGPGSEWERWPETEPDGYELPDELAEREEDSGGGEDASPYRRHGKEITANPKAAGTKEDGAAEEEEWWDCPICGRPQTADEKPFNEHIDLCLSRQTIREAVQKDALEQPPVVPRAGTPERKTAARAEKKRGRPPRPPDAVDPRQKKLRFG